MRLSENPEAGRTEHWIGHNTQDCQQPLAVAAIAGKDSGLGPIMSNVASTNGGDIGMSVAGEA